MNNVNRQYFETLMSEKKLSLRGLATRMDMNHSQLSLAFSGSRKIQIDEAAKLAEIFGQPIHRVIEAAGVALRPEAGRRVSIVGAVAGDGTIKPYPAGAMERTSIPEEMPHDLVGVQFRTAASGLAWMDGWVSFCRSIEGIDPSALGRFCLVQISGGPQVVGAVLRGYRENTHNIVGPFCAESVVLKSASPMLFTRH